MKKSDLEKVMKQEHTAGNKRYLRLWDALNLLYNKGLLTDSERETMVIVNHRLSVKARN